MVRPWLAACLWILVEARPAVACQCGTFDEPASIAAAEVVFDAWVIEAPAPWKCPLPPAPKPRAGCARIAVVAADCTVHGDLLSLRIGDDIVRDMKVDTDATTFCKFKPGRYELSGSPSWVGDPNGTLDFARPIDLVPGGSYVVHRGSGLRQRLRVGVFDVKKGSIGREATVVTEPDCGTAFLSVGQARRFFGRLAADGTVHIRGCDTARLLEPEALAAAKVAPPPPPPAPAAPPPPAPAPAPKAGCTAGTPTGLAFGLLSVLGLVRRRRTS
jgi:uncharacterized protein (TIGR03382 family)